MPPQTAAQPTAAAALDARAHSRKISAVEHSSHRYFIPRRQSQQPAHRHSVGAGGKAVQALHRGVSPAKPYSSPAIRALMP